MWRASERTREYVLYFQYIWGMEEHDLRIEILERLSNHVFETASTSGKKISAVAWESISSELYHLFDLKWKKRLALADYTQEEKCVINLLEREIISFKRFIAGGYNFNMQNIDSEKVAAYITWPKKQPTYDHPGSI